MAVNRVPNPLVGAVTEEVDPLALKSANNLSDLANVATAKANLSLGTAADATIGTAAGNVPALGAGGKLEVPVAFTPAVPGDWLVAPTTLGDAVDEAGARLSAGKVYRVGADRDYTTVQDAVDAANAAGGGQVVIDPGSWGAVTLKAGVELRGANKRGVRIGKLTLNLGTPGGNRSSHEGSVRDLRITGGAGEYDIDDTGALGAQLVIFENVDVYPSATGLGVRLQDSTIGGSGLRTLYISQGVGLYIHSGGDGTSHMLDLSSWLAVYSGNLVVNGDDADGPALRLREGALLNSERGACHVRVTGYTTLDNASAFATAPSIFVHTWEVRTNTATPIQFSGANGVVAVGEMLGATNLGQVAATLVSGVGALAWTRVEVSGYVDTSASTTTDLLQILASLLAPGAGGGPGLVQVTGGVASQDAGNVEAATWRTALGLEDLATTQRSSLREVTSGGTDGQVLTSDGLGGYTWEDATGGGGGGGGETNTASTEGAATGAAVFSQKVGVDLRFHGVAGGDGISTAVVGEDVVVSQNGYPNFARSFHFDGSTRLSITDASWSGTDFTGAYTIVAFLWLQPDAAGDNAIAGQFQPGVGGNQSWLWRIDATSGVTELLVSNGVALTTYTFNIMPTPGTWTHMAVSYNGSTTATLYMNGVQVAQAVSGAISPSSSTDPVVIGARSDGTQAFKGQMFYVRFWSDTRTAAEIADNASTVLSDLTGLDALYLFNSDVTDSSGNGNTLTVTGTATYPVAMPPMVWS